MRTLIPALICGMLAASTAMAHQWRNGGGQFGGYYGGPQLQGWIIQPFVYEQRPWHEEYYVGNGGGYFEDPPAITGYRCDYYDQFGTWQGAAPGMCPGQ